MKKMKLYVFTEVLTDYTDGMVTALCENEQELAKMLKESIISDIPFSMLKYSIDVIVDDNIEPFIEYVYGGG